MRYEYKTAFVPWRGSALSLQNLDELDARMNALGAERWRLQHIEEITIGMLLVFVRETSTP